ncbi:MAG: hypothetical protein HY852_03190 [Bradyrhizobium sp.]|uniref:hypothetical protein n=1 Tax=Bradyrhizobium sp. TaxID=376 RepID=UPI0025C18695|nr:hypothetical protein [Bradyrhizobium sp.]MBI5260808.1 hypothetical protein [Bradyrhizobium sp.]
MRTSRRTLLAGLAALVAGPAAAHTSSAGPTVDIQEATVAEESIARIIAAAHVRDHQGMRRPDRCADAHWRDYVDAARAVLDART